jgi:hypothetical protein
MARSQWEYLVVLLGDERTRTGRDEWVTRRFATPRRGDGARESVDRWAWNDTRATHHAFHETLVQAAYRGGLRRLQAAFVQFTKQRHCAIRASLSTSVYGGGVFYLKRVVDA